MGDQKYNFAKSLYRMERGLYLKDMTAAAKDTPVMELKSGRWDSTK